MKIVLITKHFYLKIDFNFLSNEFTCLAFSNGYINLPIGSTVVKIVLVKKPSSKKRFCFVLQIYKTFSNKKGELENSPVDNGNNLTIIVVKSRWFIFQ